MGFQKSLLGSAVLAALLTGCGGTGQDDGSKSNLAIDFQGIAVDGQLARALVYLDSNDNEILDSWEPRAFTDNDGYFTKNPLTNTDYCTGDDADEDFCLQSNTSLSDVVMRIEGGYDRLTGEPFDGGLSTRVAVTNNQPVENTIISPLTTLFEDVADADRNALLTALGLVEADLTTDYLADTNNDGEPDVDTALLNKALKIHKVITVLADRLQDTYDAFGDEAGVPNNATGLVYTAMASNLISGSGTINANLTSNTFLSTVMNDAETGIQSIYTIRALPPKADFVTAGSTTNVSRVLQIARQMPEVVDAVIRDGSTALTLDNAKGGARAIEAITKRMLEEESSTSDTASDSGLDEAVALFSDTAGALFDEWIAALSDAKADLGALTENTFLFSAFTNADTIETASQLPDTAEAFNSLSGKQLLLSQPVIDDTTELGNTDDWEDKEIFFFFTGDDNAESGEFTACVKFIDDANAQGEMSDGSTEGELIEGRWSIMDDYSTLLVIDFLGDRYQAIIKPAGEDETTNQLIFRSDYADKIKNIPSDAGIVESTSDIPTTDAECRELIPVRLQFEN